MRKLFSLSLLTLLSFSSIGQEADALSQHQLSLDMGSLRNRYFYPMTDVRYSSPLLSKLNLKITARLRSYGTLFIFTKSAYDFTAIVEHYFSSEVRPVYFSAGLGVDARIRLVHDERSSATSSVEPLVSVALHANRNRFSFSLPVWTRFYSNGISVASLPEVHYSAGKRFSVFLRYEISFLTIYRESVHEWRRDSFVGVQVYF
jgi:hypothetical protein